MSSSTHQIQVKAVDQTKAGFASIKGRATAASAAIGKMMRGAIAGAGAYFGARAIAGTVNELGRMSDLAMKAGMSVEDLTRASTAFQVAGLDVSVDSMAKSMQYLQKTTGQSGYDGFTRTLKTIASIGDVTERNQALAKAFGRSGMELQPLVEGGDDLIDRFTKLKDLMPGLSTGAADAGDEIADAMTIAGKGVSSIWQKVIGKICSLWGEDFPGGVRAGALNAVNYIEHFCKVALNRLTLWGAKVGFMMEAIWNFAANDYSWDDAWKEYEMNVAYLQKAQDAELEKIDRARQEYKQKLKEASVDDLAGLFGNRQKRGAATPAAVESSVGGSSRLPAISNALMMAGSNDAVKLAMLGPTVQSEAKKQTTLLEKIAENTQAVAEADVEEREHWQEGMKVIE